MGRRRRTCRAREELSAAYDNFSASRRRHFDDPEQRRVALLEADRHAGSTSPEARWGRKSHLIHDPRLDLGQRMAHGLRPAGFRRLGELEVDAVVEEETEAAAARVFHGDRPFGVDACFEQQHVAAERLTEARRGAGIAAAVQYSR